MLIVKHLLFEQSWKCIFMRSQKSRHAMNFSNCLKWSEFYSFLAVLYDVEEPKILVVTVIANCPRFLKISLFRSRGMPEVRWAGVEELHNWLQLIQLQKYEL